MELIGTVRLSDGCVQLRSADGNDYYEARKALDHLLPEATRKPMGLQGGALLRKVNQVDGVAGLTVLPGQSAGFLGDKKGGGVAG